MFDYPYLIELLTPKRYTEKIPDKLLNRFGQRFTRVMQAGCGISIPDNPMGTPRLGAVEIIDFLRLSFDPQRILLNLNTFHSREELDEILDGALRVGIRFLLVVRGDGGPALSRLDPSTIGGRFNVASSADLIGFINKRYPGKFVTGAAFNHYNPIDVELKRLTQKRASGAQFVVTQPVIGHDHRLDRLKNLDIQLVIEAWMSNNIELFSQSVGECNLEVLDYDPVANLHQLHEHFPGNCIYLSMFNVNDTIADILPALPNGFNTMR